MMRSFPKFAPETFMPVEQELLLFGGAVLLGIPAGILFDVTRLLRRLIPHPGWLTALEDMLVIVLSAVLFLCYTSAFAGGRFRMCYLIGSLAGFFLYECTLGALVMHFCDILLAPLHRIRLIFVRICRKIRLKFVKCAKKSETRFFFRKNTLQDTPSKVYNRTIQPKAGHMHGRKTKI